MEDYTPDTGEENVYSDNTREEFVASGEISPEEEAFMKGYEEADEEPEEDEDQEEE